MNNTLFNAVFFIGLTSVVVFVILILVLLILTVKDRVTSKKNVKRGLIGSTTVFGIMALAFILNWMYNPNFLPKGYLSQELESPGGQYSARVYNYTGFIDHKNVRVEVFNNETQKEKTVFYSFVDGPLQISWKGQKTIEIQEKTLNVEKDTFDFRYD
ncbi:DUF5412 family protein [Mesobacillus jeotgali]|uniref:DUF5412 family protein n=1 Tax=Mesobacillus jeotgali TaxID=129985 RepID=A0ABY9VHZ2_9BACI|nr:DUF5412 family protein [Mesobacillus jeotgali]WNF22492.1 DUF5412 family protein [Mesobacillus jeotgali]